MRGSYSIAAALGLGWMLSPEVLVRIGNGVAANRTLFLAALGLAALMMVKGITLIRDPQLRTHGRISLTGLLIQGIGPLPAMTLLLASRMTVVLVLSSGLLGVAGHAWNEIFSSSFPGFGFAFLLLALVLIFQLVGELFAATLQCVFVGVILGAITILSLAGLAGPASSIPVSMDIGFTFTPNLFFGTVLLFLGVDSPSPGTFRDTWLSPIAALFFALFLFLLWSMLSLQYVPTEQLASSPVPHLLVAQAILGESGRILMGCIIICGSIAATNTFFHLSCSSFKELAERGLLPGHPPREFRRRLFVIILASGIGTLLLGGLTGYEIFETWTQATLLLWLLLVGALCFGAGRLLQRQHIAKAWHGHLLGIFHVFLVFLLAVLHTQTTSIFFFLLFVLAMTGGSSAYWLWRQPIYDVLPPEPQPKRGQQ